MMSLSIIDAKLIIFDILLNLYRENFINEAIYHYSIENIPDFIIKILLNYTLIDYSSVEHIPDFIKSLSNYNLIVYRLTIFGIKSYFIALYTFSYSLAYALMLNPIIFTYILTNNISFIMAQTKLVCIIYKFYANGWIFSITGYLIFDTFIKPSFFRYIYDNPLSPISFHEAVKHIIQEFFGK